MVQRLLLVANSGVDGAVEHKAVNALGKNRRVGSAKQGSVREADIVELVLLEIRANDVHVFGGRLGVEVFDDLAGVLDARLAKFGGQTGPVLKVFGFVVRVGALAVQKLI